MARNTSVYEVTVEGVTTNYNTLKEVKEVLGTKGITTKAVMAGEVEGVILVDLEASATTTEEPTFTTELVEPTPEALDILSKEFDNLEIIHVGDAPTLALTNTEEEPTVLTNTEDEEPTDDVDAPSDNQLEYPEVGSFDTEKAIKKYIKGLSNDELAEWVELEGVTYTANDHESINRMRQAMAIKALHFPQLAKTSGSTKKKAKYADYTTEALVEMAIENDIEVRDDKGDMRILRMYTIMALKTAGLIS